MDCHPFSPAPSAKMKFGKSCGTLQECGTKLLGNLVLPFFVFGSRACPRGFKEPQLPIDVVVTSRQVLSASISEDTNIWTSHVCVPAFPLCATWLEHGT